MTTEFERRLLFILHLGLVELRLRAMGAGDEQAAALADILEQYPAWILGSDSNAPTSDEIREELREFERRFNHAFTYSDFISDLDPPPF